MEDRPEQPRGPTVFGMLDPPGEQEVGEGERDGPAFGIRRCLGAGADGPCQVPGLRAMSVSLMGVAGGPSVTAAP